MASGANCIGRKENEGAEITSTRAHLLAQIWLFGRLGDDVEVSKDGVVSEDSLRRYRSPFVKDGGNMTTAYTDKLKKANFEWRAKKNLTWETAWKNGGGNGHIKVKR